RGGQGRDGIGPRRRAFETRSLGGSISGSEIGGRRGLGRGPSPLFPGRWPVAHPVLRGIRPARSGRDGWLGIEARKVLAVVLGLPGPTLGLGLTGGPLIGFAEGPQEL